MLTSFFCVSFNSLSVFLYRFSSISKFSSHSLSLLAASSSVSYASDALNVFISFFNTSKSISSLWISFSLFSIHAKAFSCRSASFSKLSCRLLLSAAFFPSSFKLLVILLFSDKSQLRFSSIICCNFSEE